MEFTSALRKAQQDVAELTAYTGRYFDAFDTYPARLIRLSIEEAAQALDEACDELENLEGR
jgi:hypothetical protein